MTTEEFTRELDNLDTIHEVLLALLSKYHDRMPRELSNYHRKRITAKTMQKFQELRTERGIK